MVSGDGNEGDKGKNAGEWFKDSRRLGMRKGAIVKGREHGLEGGKEANQNLVIGMRKRMLVSGLRTKEG